MDTTKIEGHEQMVGDEDYQNLGNIMKDAYPIKVCYNTEEMMMITTIKVQQTKVENGDHLGRATRGISLEEMCLSKVRSIETKIIEGQQLGMGSSMIPMLKNSLSIKHAVFNNKEMKGDTSGKQKRKVYKIIEQQMEKTRKNKIKNRESASRSRARREVCAYSQLNKD